MENGMQKKHRDIFYTVLGDVLSNWWVALFVAVSISLLSYIGAAASYQPTYTSSTTFVVSARGSSTGAYANQSQTAKLTETFRTIMDSQLLKKKVAEHLEIDEFNGTVNVAVVPETNLLTVKVTGDSPEISFRLLNGMLEHYDEVSGKVLGEVVLEVFETPNLPSAPDASFQGNGVMKKGFLAGAVLMCVLLAVISYQKDNVKSEEEVAEKLDTRLFESLPHEAPYKNLKARLKRQKKSMLITNPGVSFEFSETIKKMRTKVLYGRNTEHGKVLLVTSAGAKEGKTVVAANLAISLAQKGKKVLLIEGDLKQSSLADFLNLNLPQKTETGLDSGLKISERILQMSGMSLYVLPNSSAQEKTAAFLNSAAFEEFLEQMCQEMDMIIVDGPTATGRTDAWIWARKADRSLLVVRQNGIDVPYINDAIDMLEGYGNGLMGCVLNDVVTDPMVSGYGYGYGYGYKYRRYGYGKYYYGGYGSYYHRQSEKKQDRTS